jgi:hypothetical protein
MKLTYDSNGTLSFNILDLIEHMDIEDKLKLIESFSCDDEVIEFVTQQLLEGYTENGYRGSTYYTASTYPHGLDRARREVAIFSSDIAAKEIERLEEALKKSQEDYYNLLGERRSY